MKNCLAIKPKKLNELPRCVKKLKSFYFLAGGTDLMVQLKERRVQIPEAIIDLSGIAGAIQPVLSSSKDESPLRGINHDKKNIHIGALTKISEVKNSDVVKTFAPSLAAACSVLGSTPIRNAATIGGNIVNASPVADTLPPLYACGAKVILTNGRGKRVMAIEKFLTGYRKTALKKGEILKTIIVPKLTGTFTFFKKLGQRKTLTIAKASLALCAGKKNGRAVDIKIALGCVGPQIIRAQRCEKFLRGKKIDEKIIERAAGIIIKEFKPITDVRSTIEYRARIISEFLKQALTGLMNY